MIKKERQRFHHNTPALSRLFAKRKIVECSDTTLLGPCWLWMGSNCNGYGNIGIQYQTWKTHRLAYLLLKGPIPEGLEIDHLCPNKNCFNPDHLECITHAMNVGRGKSGEHQRDKTNCPQGHPYDESNTRYTVGKGNIRRWCLICKNESSRRFRQRQKEKIISEERFLKDE